MQQTSDAAHHLVWDLHQNPPGWTRAQRECRPWTVKERRCHSLQTPRHLQTVRPRTPHPQTATVTPNPTNWTAAIQSTFTQQSPSPVRWPERSYAVSSLISLNYSPLIWLPKEPRTKAARPPHTPLLALTRGYKPEPVCLRALST